MSPTTETILGFINDVEAEAINHRDDPLYHRKALEAIGHAIELSDDEEFLERFAKGHFRPEPDIST